jgi:hypothetical protein
MKTSFGSILSEWNFRRNKKNLTIEGQVFRGDQTIV